jgi:hypothetical protein
MERVRDRLEAVPCDDFAYGLGTPEHPRLLRLMQERIERRESIIGKVEFAGPQSCALLQQGRLKCHAVHGIWLFLWQQNYFDSNFSGAA